MMETLLGAWVATALTLFMFSFLYKDNPLYKFGEHLFVGVSIGYTLVQVYYKTIAKDLLTPIRQEGEWILLIPALLGMCVVVRLIPTLSWLSRIAFAFIVGFGSGAQIPRIISSNVLQQIQGTIKPLTWGAAGLSLLDPRHPVNTLLILVGVIAVLFYFFFSIDHRGPIKVVARVGIYFLMVSFGAAFGYTVMARMSLLIGRVDDLILFSSPSFLYATPILLGLVVLCLILWERGRRRPDTP